MKPVTSEPADEILVNEAIAGNDEAFVQLVSRYKRKVFSLGARFARDADELDDICQDVFIKIYGNLGKFRNDAPFEHWLSRIAVRTCYDVLRKRKHEKGLVPWEAVHYEIADHGRDEAEAAEEAHRILEWGLARLKPEERLIITLLELEEKSVREVAGLTGWSETNVKVRAFRARQSLKHLLEKHHER